MKKNIVIALAALMMLAVSCKKNIVETTNNGNNNQMVQADNSSVAKLLKFKKQVEYYKANPNVKDGETMTVDEAVWNLENLFNITYTFPEYSYSELVTQEFELNINSENGQILSSDVAALYEELKNESRTLYANDGFTEDKGFLTLHAEIVNTRGGEVVKVKITTGEKTATNSHVYDSVVEWKPFVEGDDWQYGEDLGMCDNPDVESAADKELTRELRACIRRVNHNSSSTQRNVYINRKSITVCKGELYPDIFYSEDQSLTCIYWQDMNDYYDYYKTVIFTLIPQNDTSVSGTTLYNVNVLGRSDDNCIEHIITADYGEKAAVNISDFGDAVDLID